MIIHRLVLFLTTLKARNFCVKTKSQQLNVTVSYTYTAYIAACNINFHVEL